jgi:hypothetical protein
MRLPEEGFPWFITFPFLTRRRGRAIVAIARILGLNRYGQLLSPRSMCQLVLDEVSAEMLLAVVDGTGTGPEDDDFRALLREDLEEFLSKSGRGPQRT